MDEIVFLFANMNTWEPQFLQINHQKYDENEPL